jgi:hypothetical protein
MRCQNHVAARPFANGGDKDRGLIREAREGIGIQKHGGLAGERRLDLPAHLLPNPSARPKHYRIAPLVGKEFGKL